MTGTVARISLSYEPIECLSLPNLLIKSSLIADLVRPVVRNVESPLLS